MAGACSRANRQIDDVKIVAIAKKFGPEHVKMAADCGLTVIGENRVQEANQKIPLCPGHLEWHMVGHLQKNKVRHAVRLFGMIHSVDSFELLEVIDGACREIGVEMNVCMEVNVSGESSKFGLAPDNLQGVLNMCGRLMHVNVVGLMTIPPLTNDAEDARSYFRRLRELRDQCREKTDMELNELSMGMSNDFEVAIEEGATWIRLGSILFGERG